MHEIEHIFAEAPTGGASAALMVNNTIRKAYLRATGQEVEGEEENEEQKEADEAAKTVVEENIPGSKRISSIGEDCPVCVTQPRRAILKYSTQVLRRDVRGRPEQRSARIRRIAVGMWKA